MNEQQPDAGGQPSAPQIIPPPGATYYQQGAIPLQPGAPVPPGPYAQPHLQPHMQPHPGMYQPQPIYVTQQVQFAPAYAGVAPKSVGAALLLTFFFGPLGLFYASVTGGVVMLIVSIVFAAMTYGISLLLTVPACMIWAAVAASNHNARIAAPHYSQISR
jgi:hypothetical protein